MITKCKDCQFWARDMEGDTKGRKGCFRHAPVPMNIRGEIQVIQPKTTPEQSCGDGKPVPTHMPITEETAKAIDDDEARYIDIAQAKEVFGDKVIHHPIVTAAQLTDEEKDTVYGAFMKGGTIGAIDKAKEIKIRKGI